MRRTKTQRYLRPKIYLAIKGILLAKSGNSCSYLICILFKILKCHADKLTNLDQILFLKSAGSNRRSTNSDTTRNKGLLGVKGNSVLVYGNSYLVKKMLCLFERAVVCEVIVV